MALAPGNVTTVSDLITMALRDAGIVARGLVPKQIDLLEGFTRLNFILAQMRTKRLDAWHLVDIAHVSTGAQFYTVGSGKDFDIANSGDFSSDFGTDFSANSPDGTFWPDKIEYAFVRQIVSNPTGQVDIPLRRIPSYEDYADIRLKTQDSFPRLYFYDRAYPTGKVFFWPIPLAGLYEMHILVKSPLYSAASIDATFNIPPEYFLPIELSLARHLRMVYKMPEDPALEKQYKSALNVLKAGNVALRTSKMPDGLTRGRRVYNFWSDESN